MARSGAAASAIVLVVLVALVQGSLAAKYAVGGPTGWQMAPYDQPNFYQDWERRTGPFFSTDSLEFTWIEPDSVLLVDFASFIACNTVNPIQAFVASPGGLPTSIVFPLRAYPFHTLYFISGYGTNCASGQKFSIPVLQ